MDKSKNALLIFAKNPTLGKVKTRLAATIGNDRALQIYVQLLNHTQSVTNNVAAIKIVFYSDFIAMNDIWDKGYLKNIQRGADLGERMSTAFDKMLKKGFDKAVIIGTDCYDLTNAVIEDAFSALENHDVVIGPALDGCYYLLGMKNHYPQLFNEMVWSTDTVFDDTLARCTDLKLSSFVLPVLSDIDDEKDLVNTNISGGI